MKNILPTLIPHDLEKSDRDKWWFRGQHLLKEPKTLGKAERWTKKEDGQEPFGYISKKEFAPC